VTNWLGWVCGDDREGCGVGLAGLHGSKRYQDFLGFRIFYDATVPGQGEGDSIVGAWRQHSQAVIRTIVAPVLVVTTALPSSITLLRSNVSHSHMLSSAARQFTDTVRPRWTARPGRGT